MQRGISKKKNIEDMYKIENLTDNIHPLCNVYMRDLVVDHNFRDTVLWSDFSQKHRFGFINSSGLTAFWLRISRIFSTVSQFQRQHVFNERELVVVYHKLPIDSIARSKSASTTCLYCPLILHFLFSFLFSKNSIHFLVFDFLFLFLSEIWKLFSQNLVF